MSVNKRPLKRSIFIGCSVFFILLCLILSIFTYRTYTRSLYQSYNERMTDILNYVDAHIDKEDLYECVQTKVESEKFIELGHFMDDVMEDFDIHFLYIVYPVSADPPLMINIFSADTKEGRENDPDGYYLGMELYDDYESKDMLLYLDAIDNPGITFFKNFSIWGHDYTGLLPLTNSKGEVFAALCVDIEVSELENDIRTYTFVNVVLIVILGILFIGLFLAWLRLNVTDPISKLEKSVVSFAERSHEQKNPDQLYYQAPSIHTHNEVESLSRAVELMSKDMKAYVLGIVDAEGKMHLMQEKAEKMDTVAYQDALTRVKNKAWYDNVKERVDEDIINGRARFGIVMADLNNLKKVNDTYGHEHGDEYIKGACHEICVIYQHSPVFRIGGDEFVVLLENNDYDNHTELLERLKNAFETAESDEARQPWEKYSAAVGMAIFNSEGDISMDDVFKRADQLMYQDKLESKKGRE